MRPLISALLLLLLVACETVSTTQPGVVGVSRQQLMAVSSQDVNQAAAGEYVKVLADARAKGTLDRDTLDVQRVRAVTARLVPQTAAFRSDAPAWPWETHVIHSNDLNAWCMPGGKIVVYSALIDRLKLTDDELAAILGHETAHALREHAREQMSQQALTQTGLAIGGALLGLGDTAQQLASIATQVGITLPHSREHETEADRIGVELAARAGYDPHAAVSVWQKMLNTAGGGGPQFLSTHPSPANRLVDLRVYADRVMPLYVQARR